MTRAFGDAGYSDKGLSGEAELVFLGDGDLSRLFSSSPAPTKARKRKGKGLLLASSLFSGSVFRSPSPLRFGFLLLFSPPARLGRRVRGPERGRGVRRRSGLDSGRARERRVVLGGGGGGGDSSPLRLLGSFFLLLLLLLPPPPPSVLPRRLSAAAGNGLCRCPPSEGWFCEPGGEGRSRREAIIGGGGGEWRRRRQRRRRRQGGNDDGEMLLLILLRRRREATTRQRQAAATTCAAPSLPDRRTTSPRL